MSGTYAGQKIMEGFLNVPVKPWQVMGPANWALEWRIPEASHRIEGGKKKKEKLGAMSLTQMYRACFPS